MVDKKDQFFHFSRFLLKFGILGEYYDISKVNGIGQNYYTISLKNISIPIELFDFIIHNFYKGSYKFTYSKYSETSLLRILQTEAIISEFLNKIDRLIVDYQKNAPYTQREIIFKLNNKVSIIFNLHNILFESRNYINHFYFSYYSKFSNCLNSTRSIIPLYCQKYIFANNLKKFIDADVRL